MRGLVLGVVLLGLLHPAPAHADACRVQTEDVDGEIVLRYPFACAAGSSKDHDPWFVRQVKGEPNYRVQGGSDAVFLHSDRSSFSLNWKDNDFPSIEGVTPWLSWSWQGETLPQGRRADVRVGAKCDNALQVLVGFDNGRKVISYVWDTQAPVDTRTTEGFSFLGIGVLVKVIVVQSGPGQLGEWVEFKRDLAKDFEAVFGRPPKRIRGFRVQSNSQYTKTEGAGSIRSLSFTLRPR